MVVFHTNHILEVRTITDTGIVLVPYHVVRVDDVFNGKGLAISPGHTFRDLDGDFLVSLIEGQFSQTRIVNLIVTIRTVEAWVDKTSNGHVIRFLSIEAAECTREGIPN